MKKYKLNSYGWSMEAIGKSLTNEEVLKTEELIKEKGSEFIWEVRFDIDDLFEMDIWDGDLFHISKAFDNNTAYFVIEDEEGKEVLNFEIKDFAELDEGYYDNNEFLEYDAFGNLEENKNVYVSIDENKGGMFLMEFESEEIPTEKDFTYTTGSIVTPEGDWDFIDKIFFKGQELEIVDYLDNSGKASTVKIYTHDDRIIN
jgi:hypothetical protein